MEAIVPIADVSKMEHHDRRHPFDITAVEDLPPYLRTPEVAKLLRKSQNAVVQDRYLHRGPPYIRVAVAAILYDRDRGPRLPARSTRCSPTTSATTIRIQLRRPQPRSSRRFGREARNRPDGADTAGATNQLPHRKKKLMASVTPWGDDRAVAP